jgi:tetratricopeptide (TPR) repeat protein
MLILQKIFCVLVLACLTAVPCLAAGDLSPGKLLAAGRVDDVINVLTDRVSRAPNDAEAYNLLCRAYYSVGDWDRGISACEKAVALEPDNSEYHSWLGRIYGEKADHSSFITGAHIAGKVRSEFETAVRLNPKSIEARADLADFYLEAPGIVGGGRDKAEAQAKQIATQDPAQGLRVEARIAEKKKDYATAESEYRKAIQLSGGKAGTWLNLAHFYQRTGHLDKMEDAIRYATAPQMNRPDLLMPAAEMLINMQRDLPAAADLLRRYLASGNPVEDAPVFKAHYLLGTVLERQGDNQDAAEEYQAALSLAKTFSPAQTALNRLKGERMVGTNLN